MVKARLIGTLILVFLAQFSFGQESESKNGWNLPASGTIRILMVFVEIDYDNTPSLQKYEAWPKGELPPDADQVFDPQYSDNLKGRISQYFDESSFGQYKVLGDYFHEPITIKESELGSRVSRYGVMQYVSNYMTEKGVKSGSGLGFNDFDLWTNNERAGKLKIAEPDGGIDHIMMVVRNFHGVGLSTGFASQGSFGKINGKKSDSHSVFAGTDFQIMRHEYSHLVFGGNNFHCGGGQHNGGGTNYFIPLQGGWSTMGNYNSMFMTCNAWDRDRLNWIHPEKEFTISAIEQSSVKEVNADLSLEKAAKPITFILRDFVTSGDAIRVKLPYLDSTEYEQWIWIENHQTEAFNKSPFDQFLYTNEPCKPKAKPGIYMYLQVDKNIKKGQKTFKGYGDYLRVMPANGFYDAFTETEKTKTNCVNNMPVNAFYKKRNFMNPLTGTSDVENTVTDKMGKEKGSEPDGKITRDETDFKWVEKRNGTYQSELQHMGTPAHAFGLGSNDEVSMGTNPPSSSVMTLVSLDTDMLKSRKPNNRKVVLNGIKIKVLSENQDGSITVEVGYNNTTINENQRWCADSIVLPNIKQNEPSLVLVEGKTIRIDRGFTPTRVSNPDTLNHQTLFTLPTTFTIAENSTVQLNKKAGLELRNKSTMILKSGSTLNLHRRANLIVSDDSRIILEDGANINHKSRRKAKKLAFLFEL
jgi:hypothetical protein|tara:strand:+ start:5323 stop:7413 length:2091 start_codon:yes stop_codon:yes gene_type:complete